MNKRYEPYQTGGGCTAIYLTEPDAPSVYALVTEEGDTSAPDMSADDFAFDLGIYREDDGQDIQFWTIRNREHLNAEYRNIVGYAPDDESRQPYADLIELFAGALLLRANNI
jgi:hypothetical protein